MLRTYIKNAWRQLLTYRLYASINIFGLAAGIGTTLTLLVWAQHELSYDKHFQNADHIFRVTTGWETGNEEGFASTYPMVLPRILSQFPEVNASTRVYSAGLLGNTTRIQINENVFSNIRVYYADTSFFSVFALPLIETSAPTPFQHPNGVVISRSTAQRFFGTTSPLGKVIKLEGSRELVVDGIVEDIPSETHFHFDVLVNMQSHPWIKGAEEALWSGIVFHTYVRLDAPSTAGSLASKVNNTLDALPDDTQHIGQTLRLTFQPIRDIHLTSDLRFELEENGSLTYLYLFLSLALVVIAVAIINYVNLAAAWYSYRAKELGVRKVLGAKKEQLIEQILSESLLVAVFATGVALFVINLLGPVLQNTVGIDVTHLLTTTTGWLFIGTFMIATGLVAGVFPCIMVLRSTASRLVKSTSAISYWGRKSLVGFQLCISIILSICTFIIWRQLTYIETQPLGYDKDGLLLIDIGYPEAQSRFKNLKVELGTIPGITGVSACSQIPSSVTTNEEVISEDGIRQTMYYMSVDRDFFNTMDIPLAGISGLPADIPKGTVVISQKAAENLSWQPQEITQHQLTIRHGDMIPGPVAAVATDFNFQSLHHPIEPIVFELTSEMYQYALVRIHSGNPQTQINEIKRTWKEVVGDIPMEYEFADEHLTRLYSGEQQMAHLFIVFSMLSTFIALSGLFAVSAFQVSRQMKNYSIRKVLGASGAQILTLLLHDYALLTIVSLVVAVPVSYFLMARWLQQFAFHTSLSLYAISLVACLNICLIAITVLIHGIKAIRTNPAEIIGRE